MNIKDLMSRLTHQELISIVEDSGYDGSDILDSKYFTYDGKNHVFTIMHTVDDGKVVKASIFVTVNNFTGEMSAEF